MQNKTNLQKKAKKKKQKKHNKINDIIIIIVIQYQIFYQLTKMQDYAV